jgi:hypothetical protein
VQRFVAGLLGEQREVSENRAEEDIVFQTLNYAAWVI